MDSNLRRVGIAVARAKTYYERWMEKEGVPIVEGFGVTDVGRISLRPWSRLGCDGAYLQLRGLEGITGVYIGRIAPGTMTEPEKHLYEKVIYIIQGEGVAEFQQRGRVPQSIKMEDRESFFSTFEQHASPHQSRQNSCPFCRGHDGADDLGPFSQRTICLQ